MTDLRGKVMLVDDDRQTRLKLTRGIEAQGHQVMAFEGGRAALDVLAVESFDLILLDILMPELDGYEVLKILGGDPRLSDIPVIVISALEDRDAEEKCRTLGAYAYVTKPVDMVLLGARITECLGQRAEN